MSHALTEKDIKEQFEATSGPYSPLTFLEMDTYLWPRIQVAARNRLIRLLYARIESLKCTGTVYFQHTNEPCTK